MLTRKGFQTGDVYYFQDWQRPMSGSPRFAPTVCRNPWQVIGFHNREYHPARGPSQFMRGGHLVTVRSLRDGRTQTIADWMLRQAEEIGLQFSKR